MPAEREGHGWVSALEWEICLLLGLAVESPQLALGEPFLSSLHGWLRKQSFGLVGTPFLAILGVHECLLAESHHY